MVYAIVKNSAETLADIDRFERNFLGPWGFQIINQQEEKDSNSIQLTINTKNRVEDDLAQILVRRYFTDRVVGFQLSTDRNSN
ncbi:MAG: hypothetical protein AB1489_07305 [Acidobacteriota bacterium]